MKGSLASVIKRNEVLKDINPAQNGQLIPWADKLRILVGIAAGMTHLHSHGVAHRDIKLENILVTEDLIPKICDFGFSKALEDDRAKTKQNNTLNIGYVLF
jgi:serine/threonine protein kinase